MQYVQTRFEILARRIALAGVCSRRMAEEAISQGLVRVDGQKVLKNFAVPDTADVRLVNGEGVMFAPPPGPLPKLWALGKPRGVATETAPLDPSGNISGLRDLIATWHNRNKDKYGDQWVDSAYLPSHYISINNVAVLDYGIVLLTNDGDFAEKLRDPANSILTSLRIKVTGGNLADKDPEREFLPWRSAEGVKSGGVDFGRVFVKISKRSPDGGAWIRVEYVATRERDISMLLYNKAKLRVVRTNVEAFGPYTLSSLPPAQVSLVPVSPKLYHLINTREIQTTLLPKHLINPLTGGLQSLVT